MAEQKPAIPGAGGMIISRAVLEGRHQARWLFRQEAPYGNGWVCFGDGEDDNYVNNAANMTVADFNRLVELEPAAYNVFHMPVGTELELRELPEGRFFVDVSTGEPVRERVRHPMEEAFALNLQFLNKESYSAAFFRGYEGLWQRLGVADFPTGEVVLADPLAYLGTEYETRLERRLAPGSYPVEAAALPTRYGGIRCAAARLVVSERQAVCWEIAMDKGHTPADLGQPGVFSFFGVDTGLGCFADGAVANEFGEFRRQWQEEHPEQNIYDDYFAEKFAESYKARPEIQRQGGDYLAWELPGSGLRLVMFASGMGDGVYSGYWGLDGQGEPVELIVPFMNPEFFE